MPNIMSRTASVVPNRSPVLAGAARAWAATRAAAAVLAEAFVEARTMQRAAYRRYPFIDG